MIRKHHSNTNEKDVNCNPLESECNSESSDDYETSLIQLEFVKSALTVNPCMVKYLVQFYRFYLSFICIEESPELFVPTRRGQTVCKFRRHVDKNVLPPFWW